MSQRGGVKSLSLGNSHRRSLCKSSFQQEKISLTLWDRWSRPHMSPSRSRQPTLVPRWAKYGPPHWWCRIRWSWSTIMMIILINDWEECYQQSWRPPDGRRPPPEPYRPGDRWLLIVGLFETIRSCFLQNFGLWASNVFVFVFFSSKFLSFLS